MPAVRTLDVEPALEKMVKDSQFSWFHNKLFTTSNLTTLALCTHEILDVAVLPVIFAVTPNLRTLDYEFSGVFDTNLVAYNPTTVIREVNFDLGKVSHALRRVRNAFKILKFVVSVLGLFIPFGEEFPWEWNIRKASFQGLSMLEYLMIPFVGYFSSDSPLTESSKRYGMGCRGQSAIFVLGVDLWFPEACLCLLEAFLRDWKNFTPDLQCLNIELEKDTIERWTRKNPGWQEELRVLSCNIEYGKLTKKTYYVH